ncbi:MAG: hypothetical protein HY758_04210, partial [Nitrospirae bacterium]|nr:hypothetical protein [Nitrospirota bacterium]
MLTKYVAWYLVVAMFIIGIAPRVEASFAPSRATALEQVDRLTDLQKSPSVLETKTVSQRL